MLEEGSLGTAPGGGSLSTYQELCSLATDLGQPDLVYRFMDLAHHQVRGRGLDVGFLGEGEDVQTPSTFTSQSDRLNLTDTTKILMLMYDSPFANLPNFDSRRASGCR